MPRCSIPYPPRKGAREHALVTPTVPHKIRPMRDPRMEKLASVLVNYIVGVKKGQLVRLSGPPVSQPLIVALYEKVIEAGGHPAVRMVPEELNEIFLKKADDDQLRFCNPIGLYEYE